MNTPTDRLAGDSTLGNVLSHTQTRGGRVGRRVVLVVLAVLCVLALLQFFGRDTSHSVSGNGYNVTVDYSPAGRAGMSTNLTIHVTGAHVITAPLAISVSESYLDDFSVDDVSPEAASESYTNGFLQLNYDPPMGKEFIVHLRGSWETGNSAGADGNVLVSVGGHVVATVPIHSWLVL